MKHTYIPIQVFDDLKKDTRGDRENIGIGKNRESRVLLIQKFGMENLGKWIKTIKEIVKKNNKGNSKKKKGKNGIESYICLFFFEK